MNSRRSRDPLVAKSRFPKTHSARPALAALMAAPVPRLNQSPQWRAKPSKKDRLSRSRPLNLLLFTAITGEVEGEDAFVIGGAIEHRRPEHLRPVEPVSRPKDR
jgi:hypothetical protein